jgi:hypothetical protein
MNREVQELETGSVEDWKQEGEQVRKTRKNLSSVLVAGLEHMREGVFLNASA